MPTSATKRATRASVIIDAENYFRFARAAMLRSRKRIMLIGWDFDARIDLLPGEAAPDGGPEKIGPLISWLVDRNPQLEVYILRWDLGALKSVFRGTTPLTVAKWALHPRIHVRLDGHHPPGASHHQKVVVIDDCFAFCGGIDMTSGRWDTRDHSDAEERRRAPNGKPYAPWHDATCALEGPAATALAAQCRDRWKRATDISLPGLRGRTDCWPDGLEPDFHDVDVAIARTLPKMPGQRAVRDIEALYVAQIASAKRFIYAESQYFASRKIAEAIARRLDEPHGPEIVIVNPEGAEGWLEPVAMDTARARLVTALRQRDRHNRLRMYHPYTRDRTPIYVHAKILVIDDQIIRVGSSNMNNRSMGLDTECASAIAAIRDGLIGEHLGITAAKVTAKIKAAGSLIEAIEALRFTGRKNAKDRRPTLLPYEVPDLNAVEAWLADNEVLDPECADDIFETMASRSLFKRLRKPSQG